jgi:Predicted membrane protein (DUF2306)
MRTLFFYIFTCGVLFFSGIMLTKVIPYLGFEYALNFLGTKTDVVLQQPIFIGAFYIHIISSTLVMPLGISQFSTYLFHHFPNLHRWLGKIYVLTILLFAAPSGLILATFANGGLAAKVGFFLQSLVWFFTTYIAWQKAIEKKWHEHSQAMIRSFVITLAAMSLRIESYLMVYFLHTKPIETYLTVTWLSWVGNYLIAEILIYWNIGKKMVQSFLYK